MQKYKTVKEFLNDLDTDKRLQVNALRDVILKTEPTLVEHISIYLADNYEYLDPESCEITKQKRTDLAHTASYECENITVDGRKGILEKIYA